MTFTDLAEKFWLGLIALFLTGIGWLVRRVFTNEKQVDLLKAEMFHRSDDIKDLKDDIKELRIDMKRLLERLLERL